MLIASLLLLQAATGSRSWSCRRRPYRGPRQLGLPREYRAPAAIERRPREVVLIHHTRTAIDTTAGKDALVARLKESFQFCESAFAKLDDSNLSAPIQLFGPNPFSLASAMMITVGDWADHYSQEANYLRLNGVLPPTARPRTP